MKKIISLLCLLCFLLPVRTYAAYTQNDIYNAVELASCWLDKNSAPLNAPDSAASDYYTMALSRLGRNYDFASYVKINKNRKPSTVRDGQRLIMSASACGETLSDSFVAEYTYDCSSATDTAGAIIALKSGGYEVKRENYSFNNMVVKLLQEQQSNGSFNNDVHVTANALIALSYFPGLNYSLVGTHDNEKFGYTTNNAILSAVTYLEAELNDSFGYPTVTAAAFAIMALDSVGIDCDNDPAFSADEKSLLSYLMSQQSADGSFGGSAEDTALALCALTDHLLAMQGKPCLFNFKDGSTLAAPLDSENLSGRGIITETNTADTAEQSEETAENSEITADENVLPSEAPHRHFDENDDETGNTSENTVFIPIAAATVFSAAALIYVFCRKFGKKP